MKSCLKFDSVASGEVLRRASVSPSGYANATPTPAAHSLFIFQGTAEALECFRSACDSQLGLPACVKATKIFEKSAQNFSRPFGQP